MLRLSGSRESVLRRRKVRGLTDVGARRTRDPRIMAAIPGEARKCRIDQALGHDTICTESGCPFWESGGATGGCAFDRLDLAAREDFARVLADLRAQLDSAKFEADAAERRAFYERLNAGRSD
jgi:hypothetical protein